jgi:hypothetical protein
MNGPGAIAASGPLGTQPFMPSACRNPLLSRSKQMEATKMQTCGRTAIQGCTWIAVRSAFSISLRSAFGG